ncbi:MAG TPA: helix-turn-helix domain-containing protein [Gemmatimonadales bacterium]|jgi:DeoR family suf operon transcriptional repressor
MPASHLPPTGAESAAIGGPIGHRGTRAEVLRHLKQLSGATAATLAGALDCSLNAVRHHLKELEQEGLVAHDRAHHGVGAPVHAYRLSPAGHALFPDCYAGTIAHLLDHLLATQGRDFAVASLQEYYRAIGQRICTDVATLPVEERGPEVARRLDQEGFMATWESSRNGGTLTEHNCPHRVVAERFPEICAAEEAFLAVAFGGSLTRESRIADGCGACRYRITLPAPSEDAS